MQMEEQLLDRLAVSPTKAALLLDVSRPVIYQLLNRKDFPSFKIGTRRLIPVDGLKTWMAAQIEMEETE